MKRFGFVLLFFYCSLGFIYGDIGIPERLDKLDSLDVYKNQLDSIYNIKESNEFTDDSRLLSDFEISISDSMSIAVLVGGEVITECIVNNMALFSCGIYDFFKLKRNLFKRIENLDDYKEMLYKCFILVKFLNVEFNITKDSSYYIQSSITISSNDLIEYYNLLGKKQYDNSKFEELYKSNIDFRYFLLRIDDNKRRIDKNIQISNLFGIR